MADFSLPTLFVVPASQTALPTGSSTQDLTAGQVGIFTNNYVATATPQTGAYFYIAQGRENTYLQGSKRSDKIAGCNQAVACQPNVTEWYKVTGCATSVNQITEISNFTVKCGEYVTLTLRAHSSYIDTLYFNGFTRSVTVQAPCCDCGADPCDTIDANALINQLIDKLTEQAPGTNPDNISFNTFYTFENVGGTILRIHGKALTSYGQPCDVAAFPYEYDRMWFRAFIYAGPATTADFIVADSCESIGDVAVTQRSSYPRGTASEISQMEKNYYSYQAGYLKHLYRQAGYNGNFESFVSPGAVYDTFYIKFNEFDKSANNFGDFVAMDSTVIVAALSGGAFSTAFQAAVTLALGAPVNDAGDCITTTTSTTVAPASTTTTTTLIP